MKEQIKLEAKINNVGIEDILSKLNIPYPNEGLGFFKTKFCSLRGDANKNGVRLDPCLKDGICQLICQQLNFSHLRAGYVCGSILHAYVDKDNDVTLILSFYKNLYPNEYIECLRLIENNELTVSFELKVAKEDVVEMADGTRKLKKVQWDGCGLLMNDPPAYPNAIVMDFAKLDALREQDLVFAKMIQTKKEVKLPIIQQFEGSYWTAKYINLLPDTSFTVIEPSYLEGKTDDKRARHLPYKDHEGNVNETHYRFALRKIDKLSSITDSITNEELINKAQEVLNNVNITFNNKEDLAVDKKANDELLARLKESVVAEFGEEALKDWSDEDYTDEKITALRESLKPIEEVAEEIKVETVVEDVTVVEATEEVPVVEDAKTVVKTEIVETYDTDVEKVEKKSEVIVDDVKIIQVVEMREVTYTQAEVDAIKADYEKLLAEKDSVVATVKESAKKVAELRAELVEYAKDLSDEDLLNIDKVEIARLKKENDTLKAKSVVEVTAVVEETIVAKEELATSHDNSEDDGTVDVRAYIRHVYGNKK